MESAPVVSMNRIFKIYTLTTNTTFNISINPVRLTSKPNTGNYADDFNKNELNIYSLANKFRDGHILLPNIYKSYRYGNN